MRNFFLYTEKEIKNLFDYYTIYSIQIFNILKNHPKRVLDPKKADFFMTCFSDEWQLRPSQDKIPTLKCKGKQKTQLSFPEINELCVYRKLGKHYVFYHSDQDCLPENFANIPYCSFHDDSIIIPAPPLQNLNYLRNNHNKRNILGSFKGTINRVAQDGVDHRCKVLKKIKNYNSDIIIENTKTTTHNYVDLLKDSIFGLVVEGDLPWSYRLCEVINSGAIPIIIKSNIKDSSGKACNHLPFNNFLDYSDFSIVINTASIEDFFLDKIRNIKKEEIARLRNNLHKVNDIVFKDVKTHINLLLKMI